MYDASTNTKWVAMGKKLHHTDYLQESEVELLERKKTAEVWLKENATHPKYAEALKRYELICSELDLLSGKGIV
jgi:hypothetical protein